MKEKKAVFGKKLEGLTYRRRVGVYGIFFDQSGEKTAVVRTNKGYFLIGGGLEGKESHEECLSRETLEELGWEIEMQHYIGTAEMYLLSQEKIPFIADSYFYRAEMIRHKQEPIELDHQLEWIPVGEASHLLKLEHQAWAVARAHERITN